MISLLLKDWRVSSLSSAEMAATISTKRLALPCAFSITSSAVNYHGFQFMYKRTANGEYTSTGRINEYEEREREREEQGRDMGVPVRSGWLLRYRGVRLGFGWGGRERDWTRRLQ